MDQNSNKLRITKVKAMKNCLDDLCKFIHSFLMARYILRKYPQFIEHKSN